MRGESELEDLVNEVGNPYLAVLILNRRAQEVSDSILAEYGFRPLDSQAISIALTGLLPEDIEYLNRIKTIQIRKNSRVYDILNYVDDKDVCKSVKNSIHLSTTSKNLTYVYTSGLTDSQKSRIRVLTRIIWYKLLNKRIQSSD